MGKKAKNTLDIKSLERGRYAVVYSSTLTGAGHPVPINKLIRDLHQVTADLERIQTRRGNAGAVVVAELASPLSLKLVIPATDQMAMRFNPGVPTGVGTDEIPGSSCPAHGANDGVGAAACPSDPTMESKGTLTLGQSGEEEAEEFANNSRQMTLGSLNVAEKIVDLAEKEQVSLEQATEQFSTSPDGDVARKAYSRARRPPRTIDFQTEHRIVGGNHNIPSALFSAESFKLTACEAFLQGKGQRLSLRGAPSDLEWSRLQKTYPGISLVESTSNGTAMTQLLRYADIERVRVDVTVCVQENPGQRKRALVPLAVANSEEIISAVRSRLDALDEQRMMLAPKE